MSAPGSAASDRSAGSTATPCPAGDPRRPRRDPVGRGYAAPRLRLLGTVGELLELLGPAQGNYGGA